MPLEFIQVDHGSKRYREMLRIRDRILRAPLELCFDESEIAAESKDFHLAAIDQPGGTMVGCLVLSPAGPGAIQMRQVAVIESHRRKEIGTALVSFSEEFAMSQGFTSMKLHAREPVIHFYEKRGYAVVGEPFIEVTIPHREMRKRLDART